ncbi:ABC transporter ATP-binding protein [Candidatus Lokiarchaeum ossiferum]|uniref:ABC transporter ATP-binding protein n=1 Tax=Candidatus Lokiarchaeum ossiferum TaxID=2951803 RepID=UPI00352F308C
MKALSADQMTFIYKNAETKALDNISLDIAPGKFILLCGPTGSGKTSFIRAINGLIPHFYPGNFYGYFKVLNLDTVESSPAQLSTKVGTVFQIPENQLFAMDVERELAFALENLNFSREEISKRIEAAIELTKISHLRHKAPYELSGGEQQKIAIASLLALNPDILVLDEPLANLDPFTANQTIALLKNLQQQEHKTIIISEHRIEYALPYVDEIIIVKDGKLVNRGTTQQVLDDDRIYSLGLDLPPLLTWFKHLKNTGQIQGSVPFQFKTQIIRIEEFLSSNPNVLKKLANNSMKLSREIHDITSKIPEIIFDNVSFAYDQSSDQKPALSNLSFSVIPGEILGVLGPNGAGKSTMIRCINGLIKPYSGSIWVKGRNIIDVPVYDVAQEVGVMFQNPDHQLFSSTVEDELKFSLKNLKLSKETKANRIENYLDKLGLLPLRDMSPFNISGGQKKKVSLASVLCRETEILVFDEPTVGQDAQQKKKLHEIINIAHQKGRTVLVISHDLDFIAQIATRVLVMSQGTIFSEGTPNKILTNQKILDHCRLGNLPITTVAAALHQKYPVFPRDLTTLFELQEVFK